MEAYYVDGHIAFSWRAVGVLGGLPQTPLIQLLLLPGRLKVSQVKYQIYRVF